MEFGYQLAPVAPGIDIGYVDSNPAEQPKGVVLLIHGFPQTSYAFRHVIQPITDQGYRVLVPDYRGAGRSSKPASSNGSAFTKEIMAADLISLLDHLEISDPVHVVGHDIGGMVAFALGSRHPARVRSLAWGECPLPGTIVHDEEFTRHVVQQFHFVFHCVPGLPEQLIRGEQQVRTYLEHFLGKVTFNADAITAKDADEYVAEYAKEDAMRCAFETYRAFVKDAQANRAFITEYGKCRIPTLALNGKESRHAEHANRQYAEVHESGTFEIGMVEGSAHYLPEENPKEFVDLVTRFIDRF